MKYYAGIDLGGTNSKIGILDETGNIVFSTYVKTESYNGYETTIKRLSDILKDAISKRGIDYNDFVALGIGVPGPIISKSTVLMWANFDWPNNLNLAKEFEKELLKPVFVDNDANLVTFGEVWVGSAKGYSNVLGIILGTGVGAGIVVNGHLISGKNGGAGEIGHIPLERNGRLCGCGKRGCFEAYASATGVARLAKERLVVNKNNMLYDSLNGREVEAKDVFDCAKKGDKFSLDIVEEVSEYLAMGLASSLSILDSDVVVLGGGLALAGDFLLDRVRYHLEKYLIGSIRNNLEIKIASLGNDAGIYGAGYLAMQLSK